MLADETSNEEAYSDCRGRPDAGIKIRPKNDFPDES
jgi:hypothetical protein